jgi:hypothetical protein
MPPGKPPSNVGCVLALVALPFVILLGVVIGTVLRNDDDSAEEEHVTLDEGEIDGTQWRVDAVSDVEGESCVFSYLDDSQSNGACSFDPQDDTIGDETIVFGRADNGQAQVTVELSDGDTVDIDTTTAEGIDGRFYVTVVAADVDAVAMVT